MCRNGQNLAHTESSLPYPQAVSQRTALRTACDICRTARTHSARTHAPRRYARTFSTAHFKRATKICLHIPPSVNGFARWVCDGCGTGCDICDSQNCEGRVAFRPLLTVVRAVRPKRAGRNGWDETKPVGMRWRLITKNDCEPRPSEITACNVYITQSAKHTWP